MAFGFDAIISALAAAYLAETDEAIQFVSGEQERHKLDALPPRVIFLHRGGTHEAGGKASSGDQARSTQPTVSVAVELLRAECHALTDAAAYQLWANVCALLRKTYDDTVELGNFGWLTQDEKTASPCLGWAVKWQDFRFRTPVPAALTPTASATPTAVSTAEVATTGHDVHLAPSLTTSPLPASCGHNVDPPEDPEDPPT